MEFSKTQKREQKEPTLRLKRVNSEGYDRLVCAAMSCSKRPEVIDGTHRLSIHDLPLCDKHWGIRAEMTYYLIKRNKKKH